MGRVIQLHTERGIRIERIPMPLLLFIPSFIQLLVMSNIRTADFTILQLTGAIVLNCVLP
jgi:hypothetical protein